VSRVDLEKKWIWKKRKEVKEMRLKMARLWDEKAWVLHAKALEDRLIS